jgi:hypothetical protein
MNECWRRGGDSTYPKFRKLLISGNIGPNTYEYRRFRDFCPVCPFRPVCPVEPISAFYGQDGQEAVLFVFGKPTGEAQCFHAWDNVPKFLNS